MKLVVTKTTPTLHIESTTTYEPDAELSKLLVLLSKLLERMVYA